MAFVGWANLLSTLVQNFNKLIYQPFMNSQKFEQTGTFKLDTYNNANVKFFRRKHTVTSRKTLFL